MPRRPTRKTYHHGDLRRALIDEAVRIIQKEGVEGLTLRAVGARLGVSRTALYRHFSAKSALLAAVAREGFRAFREALVEAVHSGTPGAVGFETMGQAYLRFAVSHPAHYRVMFGGFLDACDREPELIAEAEGSFRVLLDAILQLQQAGMLRPDDPMQMARYVWAVTHGIAMFAIDGQLRDADPEVEMRYAIERLRTGIQALRPVGAP